MWFFRTKVDLAPRERGSFHSFFFSKWFCRWDPHFIKKKCRHCFFWFPDSSRAGSYLPGQFPEWQYSDEQLPDGEFPDWTAPRSDSSLILHFPDRTVPQLIIFLTSHFLVQPFPQADMKKSIYCSFLYLSLL